MTDNQSVLLVNSPICRICQKVYQDPKILSCLHSFCHTCLDQLHTIQVTQSQLTCPVCDVDTDIPTGGISNLTNNAFLNRISQDYVEGVERTIAKKYLTNTTNWKSSVIPTDNPCGTGDVYKYRFLDTRKEKSKLPDDLQKEASKISEKLQCELRHLQEEALRTTYSIEKVTDTVNNWQQQNSEVKTKIQQRSALLQHIIRRHETQMIAQLANQQYVTKFVQDIETAKCGLRQNLKNTIQAIEFIKQVKEFATEQDVLDMREFLLGNLATLNKVSINYKQYLVNFQTTNTEELIADDFGHLDSSQTQEVVFDPSQFGEVNKEEEYPEKADEKNVPKRLRFRRKMNKERRLTSVVDKNWRADEPTQTAADPLSDLRENIIQRRRNLLQEYGGFELPDSSMFNVHQSLAPRETKKKKRRYHSFGGRSTLSVAPPDAAILRQINEHILIASEQTSDDKPSMLHQRTISVEPILMKDTHLSKRKTPKYNIASIEPMLEIETPLSKEVKTDTYNSMKPKTDMLNQTKMCETNQQFEHLIKEINTTPEDKSEDEEWTVVTEEVVVQQTPPTHGIVQNSMSQDSTQNSGAITQKSQWTISNGEHDKTSNIQMSTVNVESESTQNENSTSDSEWTVTVEEISVPQQPTIKSQSQSDHKVHSTNLSTESTINNSMIQHGHIQTQQAIIPNQSAKINISKSEWTINRETSVPQITQKASNTMTHEQPRPAWYSGNQPAERVTQAVQEELHVQMTTEPDKPLPKVNIAPQNLSLSFPKVHSMDQQLTSHKDDMETTPGEWTVTTEEVSVPSDAFTRSTVMQEDRETRLNFLRNNWRKRKDVLKQTEGFVAPKVEGEKEKSSPVSSPTDSSNKTEKFVHFKSNLGSNIRSMLNEEKGETKVEQNNGTVMNGSRPPNVLKTDRQEEVFSTQANPSGTRLTKDRLNEYRQNMRQKTERWRIDSN